MDITVSVGHSGLILSLILHSYVAAFENLALGKPVKLSTRAGLGTPGHSAVTGKRSGLMTDGCASTNSQQNPWMSVDLGDDYLISSFFIVNEKYPEKIAKYLNNSFNFPPWNTDLRDVYVVLIQSDNITKQVWFHNGTVEYNTTISSDDPACGRYVTVRLNVTDSLTICGLEVYGQNDGNWTDWGEWSSCTKSCGIETTSRSRSCNSAPCCGSAKQTVSCNTLECQVCCSITEPHDCQDVKDSGLTDSGVYHVTPLGSYAGVDVYCDMETDERGWLVIQRRVDDSVDFNRNRLSYTSGFGEPSKTSNFWLGLRHLYQILSQGHYELLIVLIDAEKSIVYYAKYLVFKLGDSGLKYQLTVDEYTGNASDILARYNGHSFSTTTRNCTALHQGGWWSNECAYLSLNGMYTNQGDEKGVKMGSVLVSTTEMKIRRG